MLSIYRRHYGKCRNHSTRSFQCGCPIWAVGRIGGIRVRRALNLRSWDQAKELVVKWNSQGFVDLDQPKPSRQATVEVPAPTNTSARSKDPATVEEAIQRFFLNLHTRQVSPATLKKYRFLLDKQLIGFCQSRGFRYIEQLGINELDDFVGSLKDSSISMVKKMERLNAFFRWCQSRKMIAENPATALVKPEVDSSPTLPFNEDQMGKILNSCDAFLGSDRKPGGQNAKRLKVLVLLMRYSGLRIGDALRLTDDPTPIYVGRRKSKTIVPPHIVDDRIFLYTQKTGTNVYVPMPPFFFEALRQVAKQSQRYYFWSGTGKLETRLGNFERTLKSMFKRAGIPDGHSHRFRDTFAVELLKEGVPIESVSILLGHRSVKVTEKHYAPWVKERQDQLEKHVKKGWKLPQEKIVPFRPAAS
jgi:integrase/recombinase XerD